MKKFVFTLATLKKYREQVLESEKNRLGVLRGELAELERVLAEFRVEVVEAEADFQDTMAAGTDTLTASAKRRHITYKKQEHARVAYEISQKRVQIDKQLFVVIEATKDVSTVEKLEEKQLEEYRFAEMKENELFIEEFVQNETARKRL